ncbi:MULTISPECIES: hypothetical protein [unclassified Photobacterium]|uniref:hypothetical protein n=1 Tax=unclassified Photobacterium TaxID=2628852 RepID=UPI001EDFC0A3|nr:MULTISPECIES: hypothetical protein [unclassified Photobacterium]MCG3864609.1 hypothetical protein [Photobacterium sp. Ph6]MCG3876114.1 hypothetical protein [Photobacterium sp. Ph5]
MVTINHGVISLPSKPFSSASQTSSTKASTSSDAVSSTFALSSLSATQHSEWASQEYRQLQYDRPDGKHQKALSMYMDVMQHSRKEQLSDLIGINMVV